MILQEGEYLIYTDGSCRNKIGGWGFIIPIDDNSFLCGYGGAINCTNNQVEMMAAIMALSCFSGDNFLTVITDSKYLKDGMNSYIYSWVKNGYRGSTGKRVKNRSLWEDLYKQQIDQAPVWEWVKGHNGDVYNEIADKLANTGRQYAEKYVTLEKSKTSVHNFFGMMKTGDKPDNFLISGEPRIYIEEGQDG